MLQLLLTGFYKPKRADLKKHRAVEDESQTVNALWRERMRKSKYINWPTAFGVKDKKGNWIRIDDIPISFTNENRAREVFATHPKAFQLIGELDALCEVCDEYPGVVLEEKK